MSNRGEERPHYGKSQLRTIKSLWPGRKVYLVLVNDEDGRVLDKTHVTITSSPFWYADGERYILTEITGFPQSEERMKLADLGLIPYRDGSWNQTKWIQRIS